MLNQIIDKVRQQEERENKYLSDKPALEYSKQHIIKEVMMHTSN